VRDDEGQHRSRMDRNEAEEVGQCRLERRLSRCLERRLGNIDWILMRLLSRLIGEEAESMPVWTSAPAELTPDGDSHGARV
jgi:hypothetical protein